MPRNLQLDPTDIKPPHEAHDESLLARLVEDMTHVGWQYRPLLVEDITRGLGQDRYQGWTGSHRIEAARRAKLARVPCLVITVEERAKAEWEAIDSSDYKADELVGYASLLLLINVLQGNHNKGRLKALVKFRLDEAAELMREELASDRVREGIIDEPSN